MKKNRVGLKVFGILMIIIAAITALAIAFCITILPILKYNTAIKNAEKGNYTLAVKGLYKMDYKNSEELLQEYAFEAGKDILENGDKKSANVYFAIAATNGFDPDIEKEAYRLYEETKE